MAAKPLWAEAIHGKHRITPFIADPALRLVAILILVVMPLFLHTISSLLIAAGYLTIILLRSRLPLKFVLSAGRTIAFFVFLVFILNLIFTRSGDGTPVLLQGLSRGIEHSLRILIVYYAALLCIAATSQEEIAVGIAALVAPVSSSAARTFALYGFISLGFLPVFFEEYERIKMVQRFRGGGIGGGVSRKLNGARSILIPLLVSAVRRSAQLGMAVELRNVRQSIGILLHRERPGFTDYIWLLFTAGLAGFLLAAPAI
jgi:energy-coupling factor transport system permease protein